MRLKHRCLAEKSPYSGHQMQDLGKAWVLVTATTATTAGGCGWQWHGRGQYCPQPHGRGAWLWWPWAHSHHGDRGHAAVEPGHCRRFSKSLDPRHSPPLSAVACFSQGVVTVILSDDRRNLSLAFVGNRSGVSNSRVGFARTKHRGVARRARAGQGRDLTRGGGSVETVGLWPMARVGYGRSGRA